MRRAAKVFATCLLVILAAPARATDQAPTPAYVGTWGTDAAQCKIAQDQQGAPMVFSKDGYDQHEAHCTFKKVSNNKNEWKVSAACSVEGDEQSQDFGLLVAGDTLTMLDDAGAQKLVRCK